jgi:hypothetical protein
MAPYRRARRPSDNQFLPADERAWRRLIAAAQSQARAPLAASEVFVKAGDKVAQALIPLGHRERGSVFLRLAAVARGWWRLAPADKEAKAAELESAAAECAAALDAQAAQAPRPPRSDVFG